MDMFEQSYQDMYITVYEPTTLVEARGVIWESATLKAKAEANDDLYLNRGDTIIIASKETIHAWIMTHFDESKLRYRIVKVPAKIDILSGFVWGNVRAILRPLRALAAGKGSISLVEDRVCIEPTKPGEAARYENQFFFEYRPTPRPRKEVDHSIFKITDMKAKRTVVERGLVHIRAMLNHDAFTLPKTSKVDLSNSVVVLKKMGLTFEQVMPNHHYFAWLEWEIINSTQANKDEVLRAKYKELKQWWKDCVTITDTKTEYTTAYYTKRLEL